MKTEEKIENLTAELSAISPESAINIKSLLSSGQISTSQLTVGSGDIFYECYESEKKKNYPLTEKGLHDLYQGIVQPMHHFA